MEGFRYAVSKGNVQGIMYAVNEINGVPSDCRVDLDNALRSWGFDGYRCTDGDQVC